MNDLFSGELDFNKVPGAKKELLEIRELFQEFPPSDVIWDYENRSLKPAWGDDISRDIISLSKYFTTSDGKDLFHVMMKAFNIAITKQENITPQRHPGTEYAELPDGHGTTVKGKGGDPPNHEPPPL